MDTAGIRTTRGSPFFRDHVPTQDALIVTRIRAAGAITLGKTNTPEFGAGSQTFNTIFGATKNPYDLTRTCGGSSGGAAVALACGMLPIADGSDTGGSLRNPAAFCNVVGFRPSPGRVPAESGSWSPLSVSGPMARTVADVALFLSAIAGPGRAMPAVAPGRRRALPRAARARLQGRPRRVVEGARRHSRRARHLAHRQRQQVRVFERLGCLVEDAEPDFSGVADAFSDASRYASSYPQYSELAHQHADWLKDTIRFEIAQAERLTAADVGRAAARQAQMYLQVREFFERYDYFVLPVTQVVPFDVNVAVPDERRRHADGDLHRLDAHVLVRHVHGHAGHLGAGRLHAGGLPVGLQIVGPHRGDWSVLQLAHAFEQATGHGTRRPPTYEPMNLDVDAVVCSFPPGHQNDLVVLQRLLERRAGDDVVVALAPGGSVWLVVHRHRLQLGIVVAEVDDHLGEPGLQVLDRAEGRTPSTDRAAAFMPAMTTLSSRTSLSLIGSAAPPPMPRTARNGQMVVVRHLGERREQLGPREERAHVAVQVRRVDAERDSAFDLRTDLALDLRRDSPWPPRQAHQSGTVPSGAEQAWHLVG